MQGSDATASADGIAPDFEVGARLLEDGRADQALETFARLHEAEPASARLRSYHGLCLAIAERRFDRGVELCRSALKQEFFNPEHYLNLARVHMSFGFKGEALRYLRRGQMIDPGNETIRQALDDIGERRPQVLRFLPRQHVLNRWLGRMRFRIGRPSGPQPVV